MDKLKNRYLQIRTRTNEICKPLKEEDYVVQPIVDVSPPKWHLAHTTWFFETFILKPAKKKYKEFCKEYNFLFNSYYETVGKRVIRTERGNLTRPYVEDVYRYRAYVDNEMAEFLEDESVKSPELLELLELGLQHEQQHQELLITDIKYILGHNPLFPAYFKNTNKEEPITAASEMIFIPAEEGIYEIGHEGEGFCFDNELGRHKTYIRKFAVANRPVTNAEYLQFIEDDGYKRFEFWLSEGWDWVQNKKINSPLYWHFIDRSWHNYTLEGLKKIDPNAPVTHISFFEADAYAAWKGKRLLTEFEWEAASKKYCPDISSESNFSHTNWFQPRALKKEEFGFFGNTWEWTSSAYRPYPLYQKAKGAVGEYNGKFMINQMVLRGGSCAVPSEHIRHSYRNFFHPHLQWQFTGIRLAED